MEIITTFVIFVPLAALYLILFQFLIGRIKPRE